jgi:N-acetyl-anhydromuramyl-L-alanine amidase AmpD
MRILTMQRSPLSLASAPLLLTTLALLIPGCDHGDGDPEVAGDTPAVIDPDEAAEPGVEEAEPLDPPTQDPGFNLGGIDGEFADAADEFSVPVQLLQAIGYVESQWQMVEGQEEFEGLAAAHGVMALRGDRLDRAAELAGVSVDDAKTQRRANIRAGAALLSAEADALGLDRSKLGAWAPAVANFSGIPTDMIDVQANYVHNDVYARMRDGMTVTDSAGHPVASMLPADAIPEFVNPVNPSAAPGPDYGGSVWRASPNYSSRSGGLAGTVKMVIIHSCEGAYSGCWGWLVNKASGVSAHYVVKEDGSEISQLVKEANKAWHIGASYDCKLNSSKECSLNGYNANGFTVGIEHAGFAKQGSWNAKLIDNSAKLVCDISKAHGVPRDKYHIVAHGQLQPYNRIDPGPNWPWATFLNKVNSHCGVQPQPDPQPQPQPDPQPGSSIVVDSNNAKNDPSKAKIAVSGNWTSTAATAGYYGTGYFYATTSPVSDAAEFSFYMSAAGTRTIDAWWTAGTNRSTKAPFVAFDAAGNKLATFNADQSKSGGKWVELGSAKFTKGWNKVVLSRWTGEGKVVIADAVRLR